MLVVWFGLEPFGYKISAPKLANSGFVQIGFFSNLMPLRVLEKIANETCSCLGFACVMIWLVSERRLVGHYA